MGTNLSISPQRFVILHHKQINNKIDGKNDQIFRSYRTRPALFPRAHTRRCMAQATRMAAPQSATLTFLWPPPSHVHASRGTAYLHGVGRAVEITTSQISWESYFRVRAICHYDKWLSFNTYTTNWQSVFYISKRSKNLCIMQLCIWSNKMMQFS